MHVAAQQHSVGTLTLETISMTPSTILELIRPTDWSDSEAN